MRSLLTSLVAAVALIAAIVLWIEGHDHAALFAVLVTLSQLGGEVFGRDR